MKRAGVFNLFAFNAGWFSCILGAGNGLPWLGPLCVAVLAGAHLVYHSFDRNIIALYLLAFVLGIIADGSVVLSGYLTFPEHARLLTPLAIWMPCMWVNFATSLHLSLAFLKRRYLLAALLGLISAPGTYFAGMKLGAVTLAEPIGWSMAAVGLEWLIAMPLLILFADRFSPRAPDERRTDP